MIIFVTIRRIQNTYRAKVNDDRRVKVPQLKHCVHIHLYIFLIHVYLLWLLSSLHNLLMLWILNQFIIAISNTTQTKSHYYIDFVLLNNQDICLVELYSLQKVSKQLQFAFSIQNKTNHIGLLLYKFIKFLIYLQFENKE